MARYTYRHYEVRRPVIDGYACNLKDHILEKAVNGQTWCVHGEEFRYYTLVDGKWIGSNTVEKKWELCKFALEVKKPALSKEDYPEHYTNPWNSIHVMKDSSDNERYFKIIDDWANNGGAIRDEYLCDYGFGDTGWSGRGLPTDCSPELLEVLKDEDGELPKYHYTNITLSELRTIYDKEETRILGLIKDSYIKQMNSDINKKLDFIIVNMKDPISMNLDDLKKKKVNPDDEYDDIETYDEDNDYYESPEYIIEEYMPNLYLLCQEIAKLEYVAQDIYDVYSDEDIRVIHYVC